MYTKHFGLRREPFSIAPDPRFLFMSERHREALAHLLYGLKGSGGVVLLTGEIGAGKTTVCRCFLEQIPPKCNVAYIFNPKLTVLELLQTICEEFHITLSATGASLSQSGGLDIELPPSAVARTVKEHVDALNAFLLTTHARGENNVLIIDEAQNLAPDVLEQLRLLTNLETSERKLLQIVLIGQPELRLLLARPDMEQLAQRITARYHLEALNEAETVAYIRHRLVISGRTGGNPFDSSARPRIHKLARGVPRRINLLCDRAMLGAYARGTQRINATMIDEASKEVFGPDTGIGVGAAAQRLFTRRSAWAVVGALGGAAALALVMWAWPLQRAAGPEKIVGTISPPPRATTAAGTVSPAPVNNAPRATTTQTPPASNMSPIGSPPTAPPTATPTTTPAATPASPNATTTTLPAAPTTPAPAPAPTPTPSTTATIVPNAPNSGAPSPAPSTPTPAALGAAVSSTVKPIRDEFQAWRLLSLAANLTLGEGNPCQAADRLKLACTRRSDATLEQLRRSTEPTLLILREGQGPAIYLVHTGQMDERSITVRGEGGERVRLDVAWLQARWRGEVGNFKAPPNVATRSTP